MPRMTPSEAFVETMAAHGVTDIFGLKLLTQLRVHLNDLRVHRFRHGFRNCPSAL